MTAKDFADLDFILNGDYMDVFRAQNYFSADNHSTGHVFDVIQGSGVMRSNVGGKKLVEIVKDNRPGSYDIRVIFVDCVETDHERLSLASADLRAIFDTFHISPRFADLIARQHMPGSTTTFDQTSHKPHKHELWYSGVIRSSSPYGDETARDLSRKVADWIRFSIWSRYDLFTKVLHVVVLGCPLVTREKFESTFRGKTGLQLQRHPMVLHAFFTRALLLKARDFLQEFAVPLYQWEFKAQQLKSANDYTKRVQVFLAFSRQMQQFCTDYDILDAALEHLKTEHQWFEQNVSSTAVSGDEIGASTQDEAELRATLRETFDFFIKEAKLIRTYHNLYNERSKLGVSEGFAMVNQRDAEVNLQMATESTQIARASHQDSRALRVIQILSMLFLPASLVSSIFGMGFFSTSQGTDGQAVFTISKSWWLYLAISLPLTVLCLMFMGFHNVSSKSTKRRKVPLDTEKAPSNELKTD